MSASVSVSAAGCPARSDLRRWPAAPLNAEPAGAQTACRSAGDAEGSRRPYRRHIGAPFRRRLAIHQQRRAAPKRGLIGRLLMDLHAIGMRPRAHIALRRRTKPPRVTSQASRTSGVTFRGLQGSCVTSRDSKTSSDPSQHNR